MGKIVGFAAVLFVLAVGFVALTHSPETADLLTAFRAAPLTHKVAWAVIVAVPLLMLPFAAWLWDSLARQRFAAIGLEQRLDGVRAHVKDLGLGHADVEGPVQKLTRSDPEDSIIGLERRISEAERFAEVQKTRNEAVDLETRIGVIRARQQALSERLGPVLDARRTIEKTFAELDTRQTDVERSLAEVASGEDGVALDVRLKNLTEFVNQGNARCDRIEHASKTVVALDEACAEIAARLAPFAAAQDGITSRIRELNDARDRLSMQIEGLERAPDGELAGRVQRLAEDRKKLDEGISRLGAEFYKLAGLRNDAAGLNVAFDNALDLLSLPKMAGGADAETRIRELTRFIEQTQDRFGELERRVIVLGQLKSKLEDLKTRLAPLESGDAGAAKLVGELHDLREELLGKIRQIEGGEEGGLNARVSAFSETKRDLEERVTGLSDQFAKLASIRNDIAGLFAKLSDAVDASSR